MSSYTRPFVLIKYFNFALLNQELSDQISQQDYESDQLSILLNPRNLFILSIHAESLLLPLQHNECWYISISNSAATVHTVQIHTRLLSQRLTSKVLELNITIFLLYVCTTWYILLLPPHLGDKLLRCRTLWLLHRQEFLILHTCQ